MNKEELRKGAALIPWAYALILFNFNLNEGNISINLLPAWGGWLLFASAVKHIIHEKRSVGLLLPLTYGMAAYQGVVYVLEFFGISNELYIISTIAGIINVYFFYQLFNDLAVISKPMDARTSELLMKAGYSMILMQAGESYLWLFGDLISGNIYLSVLLIIVMLVQMIFLFTVILRFSNTVKNYTDKAE